MRSCWHMASIAAGFEAIKIEACFKPSQKKDERGRKIGLFLFWICNVKQSLEDCQEGNAWKQNTKLVHIIWIHSQWVRGFFVCFFLFGHFPSEILNASLWSFDYFSFCLTAKLYQCLLPGSQQQNKLQICQRCQKHEQKWHWLLIFKHFPLEVSVSTLTTAPHAHVTVWRFSHVPTPSDQICDSFAYFKLKCCLFCLDFLNILLVWVFIMTILVF